MKIIFYTKYCLWCGVLFFCVKGFVTPESCTRGQYYEPSSLACENCPVNVSMVTSKDGFGCSCEEHSIPVGISRCKLCGATQMVSADGTACVPRKCQNSSDRIVCKKCPSDYITVTQNLNGSPLKEVLCVKCSRGFRVEKNACVRCESCTCNRNQVIVRGVCIPKSYVNVRPKYEENSLHPLALLDVVKHEYLCMQNDTTACRTLANECVRNFYSPDPAGPCRLWTRVNLTIPRALPQLATESKDKIIGEIILPRGKGALLLAAAMYTSSGGFLLLKDVQTTSSQLPVLIRIGHDFSLHHQPSGPFWSIDYFRVPVHVSGIHSHVYMCTFTYRYSSIVNISNFNSELNNTYAPYLYEDGKLIQVPVYTWKVNGHIIKKGKWQGNKFTRYFLVDKTLSTAANITNTIYLQTAIVRVSVQRDKHAGSMRVKVTMEAHYALKPFHTDFVHMSLRIVHDMPPAGILRGLEIWGGVLGSVMSLYAVIKWRGAIRRGGLYVSIVPLLSASTADTLYFAAWFSTLHALAAQAGTLGITLPLSRTENNIILILIYTSLALKTIKVVWLNFKQCRCDICFLDWSEYNPPFKDRPSIDQPSSWRAITLAREWSVMQTKRRVSPGLTVTIALLILKFMTSWMSYLPQSSGYKWSVATLAWWSAYFTCMLTRWVADRIYGSPSAVLCKICTGVNISLLVFEEEYYAHYVHGRNDDFKDLRAMGGPLATCRVVCAPQLRAVYKQLHAPASTLLSPAMLLRYMSETFLGGPWFIRSLYVIVVIFCIFTKTSMYRSGIDVRIPGLGEVETKQALLSCFLAAFFERALDGISWVASERSMFERLLDVELNTREAGHTSTLLYDPENTTPSCFSVTWWGEEWSLATFDAMLFSTLFVATENTLLAALVTLLFWQVMKQIRGTFGKKNQKAKTGIEIY